MNIPRPAAYVAHTPSKKNPHWHLLTDHIYGVTALAEEFAEAFDATRTAAAWARYLGLLHDLGKFTDTFQTYLETCHLADHGLAARPKPGSAPHKQMGALAALDDMPRQAGMLFALPLYGHHGGMEPPGTDGIIIENKILGDPSNKKTNRAEVKALRTLAARVDAELAAVLPDLNILAAMPYVKDPHHMEMFLRMLFSCLTDADSLDTEQHMNPSDAGMRQADAPTLSALRDLLKQRQTKDFAQAIPSTVNQVRREVYDACLTAAKELPGVFHLTVPTGGGKTRSGLAFALEHAAAHGLRRVVYAIPYTSIVDQTAQVFRDLFGSDPGTVLEHHSAIEPKALGGNAEADNGDDAELWRRLATQNWDAPLVVTTTVQLFESLFSNRPGACRKLHRLAHSVLVLDEVQTLPAHLLTPLIDGLKILTEHYGVSVVLCTATQPALEGTLSRFFSGFARVHPIIPPTDRDRHFALLRRVRYRVAAGEWDWKRIAQEMTAASASLCILNTRRQARQLMDALDPTRHREDVFHLSTLMCGHHRRAVLNTIRERLKAGLPTLLVSTSLIECGVDLDFPRVLRAIGPLDRIVQAAGRCNREGRRPRDESEVVVFTPAEGGTPGGLYLTALRGTIKLYQDMQAKGEEIDFDDPALVTRYFQRLYSDLQGGVDAKKVQERRMHFDYREVAARVKLVDEDTVSVLVTGYKDKTLKTTVQAIKDEAYAIGGMTRLLWQKAQPLCVSLPRIGIEGGKLGIDPIRDRLVLGGPYVWEGRYDGKTGIPLPEDMIDGPDYKSDELIVSNRANS